MADEKMLKEPVPAKFKAVVEGLVEGRPRIGYGGCLNQMKRWAQAEADANRRNVSIYEMGEKLVETVTPTPPPPDPPKAA